MVNEVPRRQKALATQEEIDAVASTATSGSAVRISINDRPLLNLQAKLRYEMLRRGLKMSYSRDEDGKSITVWVEGIPR